jgi:regulator of sirC expression with transglutaminase-like and TPR domain
MAAVASEMAGPGADDARKLAAVRTFIYRAGAWNDNRPFAYDLADPYGQTLSNKLLSTYLSTRRGNCVSMPVLFLILADRLGVNVTLSTAPLHVFLKFTDATGKVTNLEPTSGALPSRDQWYREKLPMTDQAVDSGLYLRTLSRTESVALMATTVMEHLLDQGRYQDAIDVADVILAHSPRDGETMVKRGSAFGRLMEEEFYKPYPTPDTVPPHLHGRYRQLESANQQAFAQAEALGWTPTEMPT